MDKANYTIEEWENIKNNCCQFTDDTVWGFIDEIIRLKKLLEVAK